MMRSLYLLLWPAVLAGQVFGQLSPLPFAMVTDCGVVGDKSHDDTDALNACIAALPDYHTLYFRAGLKIKITGTINIHQKYGIRLVGLTSMFGGPSNNTDAPTIFWYGSDGGTMVDIDRTQNFLIEGLTLLSADNFKSGSGGAATGFNVDEVLSSGPITTNGIFDRVAVFATQANTSFRGIAFALNSNVNVEHMTVRNSSVSCSYNASPSVGQGIVLGPSQNALKHLYMDNSITNCATGIYLANGSADILHNQFNTNVTHISAVPITPIAIEFNDAENGAQFFVGNGTYGATIRGNRIAAISPVNGHGAIEFTGGSGGAVLVESNDFGAGDYIPISGGGAPFGAPALISRGNRFPGGNGTKTTDGFKTFGYNAVSQMDGTVSNGRTLLVSKGATSLGDPLAAFGLLDFDYTTQKWVASENGAAYKKILPWVQASAPTCDADGLGNVWVDTTTTTSVYKICLSVSGTPTWVTK